MSNKLINTPEFSSHLRSKGLDLNGKKILITSFNNTSQQEDLTLPPNCEGFGRIHHFRRKSDTLFPDNPLPIDPALHFLQRDYVDEIKVQVFQNAFCSWRCWYCFVDYRLLSADKKYSEFKSAKELVDLYLDQNAPPSIIDLSGGQPDLVPEWSMWMCEEFKTRGLSNSVYLWSDDNLSNDYLWKYLTPTQIQSLASSKNYGRVGCFKGFDETAFSFNTMADPSLWLNQFKIMKKLITTGFDVYGYVTLTSNADDNLYSKISTFVDKLQNEVHPLFPLRTVPLKITQFTPTKHRMSDIHLKSLAIQQQAVIAWNEELEKRFTIEEREKRIHEHLISS